VDYLKYDNCYNDDISPLTRTAPSYNLFCHCHRVDSPTLAFSLAGYPIMRDALNATNRKIFYSMYHPCSTSPTARSHFIMCIY
jgi:hypothetical protein